MATILCITTGLSGILNASLELMSRLENAGHKVIAASPLPVGDYVRHYGFGFFQLEPIQFEPAPAPPNYTKPLVKLKRWLYKIRRMKFRRMQAVTNLGMEKFLKQVQELRPDLVMIDVELHEHLMTIHQSGIRMLILSQWFSLWNRPGLPPITSSIIPGVGFSGSPAGLYLTWQWIKIKRWWIFLKKKVLSGWADRRSILKKYAVEIDFPRKLIRENYWPGPFTYDQLTVLAMTAQEWDFPHSLRPNFHYVGPMVFEKRREHAEVQRSNEELKTIVDRARKNDQKIIYCSVSSFSEGDQNFIRKVIDVFRKFSEGVLIVTLGRKLNPGDFKDIPENVYIFSWVPQLEVLAKADCSINHGGIHTIHECIFFGVPMLIYSGKRSDQDGCAARMAFHKLGITGDKDLDGPDEIYIKLERILKDRILLDKIESANRKIKFYRDARILEDFVFKALEKSA